MFDITQPGSFLEAIAHHAAKALLPTSLSSAELSQIDAGIRRQSLFSARTLMTDYLQVVKDSVASVLQPTQEERPDRATPENPRGLTTVGLNPATAREQLRASLADLGYTAAPGEEGTIKDLSSTKRLDLVINTNTDLARGAGAFVQQNVDPESVDLWPALELYRIEAKNDPRDWPHRWRIAAQVAGDPKAAATLEFQGRMIALKSSGIWAALGEGAGGYTDTLGNPYPPFAFNSGMWTRPVDRIDAEKFGLITPGEQAEPNAFDLSTLFKEAA